MSDSWTISKTKIVVKGIRDYTYSDYVRFYEPLVNFNRRTKNKLWNLWTQKIDDDPKTKNQYKLEGCLGQYEDYLADEDSLIFKLYDPELYEAGRDCESQTIFGEFGVHKWTGPMPITMVMEANARGRT